MADVASLEWERRVEQLWTSIDDFGDDEFVLRIERLVSELPADDPVGLFEYAGALDATDRSDLAISAYRGALELGLGGGRRRQAVIQLASSLRNVGQAQESVALLAAELEMPPDELDDAVAGFLALSLLDTGRQREAVSAALTAPSRHPTRYQRSLRHYARLLVEPGADEE